jgi:hypothetical protein
MPTKNPRINVSVEEPVYRALHSLAAREGVSMSSLAHDLIREALELREDAALSALAGEREETLDREKALSHEEVWR